MGQKIDGTNTDLMAKWRQSGGASVHDKYHAQETSDEPMGALPITRPPSCAWQFADDGLEATSFTSGNYCPFEPADEGLTALPPTANEACRAGPADEGMTAYVPTIPLCAAWDRQTKA